MTKIQKVPTGPFHPGYGCAILVIAVITFGSMVSWMLYSGYEQDRQISAFTVPDAPPLAGAKPSTAEKDALKKRVSDFSSTLFSGQSAKLTLSVADLNTLIILCSEAGIADYWGVVRFTGMDPQAQVLQADIRWQMNNLPLTNRKDRFLVGQATFKPDFDTRVMELRIRDVKVPGKTVSEGFLHQLQEWPWLNLAKGKPDIAAVLGGVTTFQITPEKTLVLDAKPVPKPVPPPAPRAK